MAEMKMNIEMPTRLCMVHGKLGYFHLWEQYSTPVPASPMIGGEPAGIFSRVFGIVEFDDGMRRVDPTDIVFHDEENDALYRMNAMQGPKAEEDISNGRET